MCLRPLLRADRQTPLLDPRPAHPRHCRLRCRRGDPDQCHRRVIELVNPAAERNHFGDLDVPKSGIKSTATLLAGVAEPLPGCGLVLCSGSILEVVADTSADERIARLLRVVGGTLIKTAGFVDRLGLNPPLGPSGCHRLFDPATGGTVMGTGTVHYAHEHGTWILKLAGDVRHDLAPAVNALLDRAFAGPGIQHFLIDLSGAHAIASTCLGLLARIANHLSARGLPRAVIIAPGNDIQTTLHAVCFDRVFQLVTESAASGAPLEPLTELDVSERDSMALVLDAHRRLSAIDARNCEVFRDVIELLERELGDGD